MPDCGANARSSPPRRRRRRFTPREPVAAEHRRAGVTGCEPRRRSRCCRRCIATSRFTSPRCRRDQRAEGANGADDRELANARRQRRRRAPTFTYAVANDNTRCSPAAANAATTRDLTLASNARPRRDGSDDRRRSATAWTPRLARLHRQRRRRSPTRPRHQRRDAGGQPPRPAVIPATWRRRRGDALPDHRDRRRDALPQRRRDDRHGRHVHHCRRRRRGLKFTPGVNGPAAAAQRRRLQARDRRERRRRGQRRSGRGEREPRS